MMNANNSSIVSSVEEHIIELIKTDQELFRMLPPSARPWRGPLAYEAAKAVRAELVKRLKELN